MHNAALIASAVAARERIRLNDRAAPRNDPQLTCSNARIATPGAAATGVQTVERDLRAATALSPPPPGRGGRAPEARRLATDRRLNADFESQKMRKAAREARAAFARFILNRGEVSPAPGDPEVKVARGDPEGPSSRHHLPDSEEITAR